MRSRLAGESSVSALGFVDQVHVRFDPALVHQPPDHIGRAVASIGDQARRSEVEPFSRSVEHSFGRANFRLANGCPSVDESLPFRTRIVTAVCGASSAWAMIRFPRHSRKRS
jgi:hypothetical protein